MYLTGCLYMWIRQDWVDLHTEHLPIYWTTMRDILAYKKLNHLLIFRRLKHFWMKYLGPRLWPSLLPISRAKVRTNYTRQKKKRTTTIFPFRSPLKTKMLIVLNYSFLIKSYKTWVWRRWVSVPSLCRHNTHQANGKRVAEALIQQYCLHGIPSMFYICKVWKRYVVFMWDNQCAYWCIFVIPKSSFISKGHLIWLKQCWNL